VISFCNWRGANVSSAQVFRHFNLHINTEKVDRQSRQCTACDFVCARVINGRLICARGPFHYGLETKVNSLHSLLFLHLHTHTHTLSRRRPKFLAHTLVRAPLPCVRMKNAQHLKIWAHQVVARLSFGNRNRASQRPRIISIAHEKHARLHFLNSRLRCSPQCFNYCWAGPLQRRISLHTPIYMHSLSLARLHAAARGRT
jgi:hypothetical protein